MSSGAVMRCLADSARENGGEGVVSECRIPLPDKQVDRYWFYTEISDKLVAMMESQAFKTT